MQHSQIQVGKEGEGGKEGMGPETYCTQGLNLNHKTKA